MSKENVNIPAQEPSGSTVTDPNTGIDINQELAEQSEEFWASRTQKERRHYYSQIDLNYHTIVDEFFKSADNSVDKFRSFTKSHVKWRWLITILAGVLATLNIIVAYTAKLDDVVWLKYLQLPLVAAVFASIIAIVSNLENLNHYADRAQAYREIREMALNAAREYEMFWHIYVRPFSDSPKACVNAVKLYRQVIEKDEEIRGQTKELTKAKKSAVVQESGPAPE
jgi:hypothetical protein